MIILITQLSMRFDKRINNRVTTSALTAKVSFVFEIFNPSLFLAGV
jgi:hypothetical protein